MKKILLLGASGGIGMAIAQTLTQDDVVLFAAGSHRERLEKMKESVPKNAQVEFCLFDLEDQKEVEKIAGEFKEPVDWIINSAGYIHTPATPLEQETPETMRKTFEINLFGPSRLIQLLLKNVKKGIINISSTSGINGNGSFFSYSLAKASVNMLGQTIAKEFNFRKDNRTSIVLCPAGTKTEMRMRIVGTFEGGQEPQAVAEVVKKIIDGTSPYKNGDIVIIKDGESSLYKNL